MNGHETESNPQPALTGGAPSLESGAGRGGGEPLPAFSMLDIRVIHVWRIQHLISSFILLLFLMVGGGVAVAQYRPAWPWVGAGWLAIALLRAMLLFWYPSRSYAEWGYRVDERVLETKHGILFRTVALLPLSRLQHVDLNRGPLERMFGLASLTLYTAGTQQAAIEIPGLEAREAARLRDQLVALGAERGKDGG